MSCVRRYERLLRDLLHDVNSAVPAERMAQVAREQAEQTAV